MSDPVTPEVEDVEPEEEPAQPEKSPEEPFDAERAKRALAKKNSEAENLRKRLRELEPLAAKAKELEDAGKSETEKLVADRDTYKGRADKAEVSLRKLTVALDAAPEGASLAQVRAVAKRLSGDTDEALAADAEELYELLGARKGKVPDRPREKLRGGGNPDEPVEETDPRKLAALIQGRN